MYACGHGAKGEQDIVESLLVVSLGMRACVCAHMHIFLACMQTCACMNVRLPWSALTRAYARWFRPETYSHGDVACCVLLVFSVVQNMQLSCSWSESTLLSTHYGSIIVCSTRFMSRQFVCTINMWWLV